MTNSELVQAMFNKAYENRWNYSKVTKEHVFYENIRISSEHEESVDYFFIEYTIQGWIKGNRMFHINEIIFNKEWAKAFFGCDYEYHLQRLSLLDDRLEYLKQFLNK